MATLPRNVSQIVDSIASRARSQGDDDLLGLLDQAEASLEFITEDWNRSIYRLELTLPSETFNGLANVEAAESRIGRLAESVTERCSDGVVRGAALAPAFDAPSDWRSGSRSGTVSSADAERIWEPGHFRLFISHSSAHKDFAHELKAKLGLRFVCGFVAHDDIEPSRAWAQEIAYALGSCHAMIALISEDFHSSVWCMQEVGWGLGRGILVQPVKLTHDPKGFIGSIQATPKHRDLAVVRNSLVNLLAGDVRTTHHMHEPLVRELEQTSKEAALPFTVEALSRVAHLSESNARRILNATQTNSVVKGCPDEVRQLQRIVERFGIPQPQSAISADEYDPFAED